MNDIKSIYFLQTVIDLLRNIEKSADIASLLIELDSEVNNDVFNNFVTELSLTASPDEEVGVGCYSLEHLQNALNEIKETGKTELLDTLKD